MKQILSNSWEDLVDFLVECSQFDKSLRNTLNFCRSIAIERKITIYDSLFIVMYGNAKVKDIEFCRRLN